MDLKQNLRNFFQRSQTPYIGLLGAERIVLIYAALTAILLVVLSGHIDNPWMPCVERAAICLGIVVLWRGVYRMYPSKATLALRVLYQVALLGYWYPDIYNMAQAMPDTDHLFAAVDQAIFGYQPALRFSQVLSGPVWNEVFCMGYFSYYLMIAAVTLWPMFGDVKQLDRVSTLVVGGFMFFYLIFIFLLSAGPQFYFPAIGMEYVEAGVFPPLGDYFRTHAELHHAGEPTGLFSSLVMAAQESEKPIAAFPSSHVGASTILIWIAWKLNRRLGLFLLPFYIILCLATVYIGAHYAIDVLGGWVFAVVIYQITRRICQHWSADGAR